MAASRQPRRSPAAVLTLLLLALRQARAQLEMPSALPVCELVDIHDPAGVGVVSWGLEVWFVHGGVKDADPVEVIPCYGPDCYWRVDMPESSTLAFCSNLTLECPVQTWTVGANATAVPSGWAGPEWCMAKNTGVSITAALAEATSLSLASLAGSSLPSGGGSLSTSPPTSPTPSSAAGGGGTSGPSAPPSGTRTPTSIFPGGTPAATASDGQPVATQTGTSRSGSGLSAGAIAGVAVGGAVGLALVAALLFLCCRHRRRKADSRESSRQLLAGMSPSPKNKYSTLGSWGRGSWGPGSWGRHSAREPLNPPSPTAAPEMAQSTRPDALGRSWAAQPAEFEDAGVGFEATPLPPPSRGYGWTRSLPMWGGASAAGAADPFRRGSGVRVMSGELNPIAEERNERWGRSWGSSSSAGGPPSRESA